MLLADKFLSVDFEMANVIINVDLPYTRGAAAAYWAYRQTRHSTNEPFGDLQLGLSRDLGNGYPSAAR